MLPSWIRSSKGRPRPRDFLAIETTSLRFFSISLLRAALSPSWPSWRGLSPPGGSRACRLCERSNPESAQEPLPLDPCVEQRKLYWSSSIYPESLAKTSVVLYEDNVAHHLAPTRNIKYTI